VVSSFFETFGRHTGVQCNESSFSTDELIRIFWQRFGESRALTRSLTWFERRFYPIVDIDVYRYEFDSSGFQVINHHNTSILLLRCELPDETKNDLLKSFLQLASFSLTNSNIGAQKDYAETYQSFKQSFVPPAWFLSKMYDSRYFTHFYAGQRDMWIARWTKRPTA
jgi:hypothetical protein